MTGLYKHNISLLKSISNKTSGMERVLYASIALSLVLTFFRMAYTGELMFLFLTWNLFLAWVPFRISKFLISHPNWIERNDKFLLAFFLWLLFIPNSFYLLTDLFHLKNRYVIPFWYDLALILSFSWNGLLLGILSVRQMEKIISVKYQVSSEWLFIAVIMLLNGLGIYIGRYLRFNSWDIIADPFDLFGSMVYLFIHPIRNRFDWSMIICFSALLTVFYLSLKRISKEML